MHHYSYWKSSWPAVLLLAGAGCAGGFSGSAEPVPVKGALTLDGQPVEKATIQFVPQGGRGRLASAVTDKDGTFRMTTLKPGDGAAPGEYKVIVQYSEGVSEGAAPVVQEGQSMKAMWDASQKAMKEKKKPKYVIPPRYSDPNQTVLKQKVPTEGEVKLDLQSK